MCSTGASGQGIIRSSDVSPVRSECAVLVRLLGRVGVTIEVDGGAVDLEPAGLLRKGLLAMLALQAGEPVPVDRLTDGLWGSQPPRGAVNSLQAHVSALRRTLPDDGVVVATSRGYRLTVPREDVDALRAAVLVERARSADGPDDTLSHARAALALWHGPALADVRSLPGIAGQADRFDALHLAALTAAINARLALGEGESLVPELQHLVAEHPFDETLHAGLMTALYRAGRQTDALAAYRELRTLLAGELGVEPGPGVRDVHAAVLRHDPELLAVDKRQRSSAPVQRTVAPRRIPAPLSSFIGRQEELDRVRALLRGRRLVTVVGPGGAGKSRLALEAALVAHRDYALVAVIPLADVTSDSAERIFTELAAALGLDGEPDQTSTQTVLAALSGRRAMLVLDNAEHLLGPVVDAAGTLLGQLDEVRLLVTSREPLGIPGEQCLRLEPLPVPMPSTTAEQIAASPAVQLLVDRAAARDPEFRLAPDNAAAVGELCRRLDGLPLALELVAPRLHLLSPDELVRGISEGAGLLSAGTTALPKRHRSIDDAIRWSYDLLDDDEQHALHTFAAFTEGASVEGLSRVCRPDAPVLASVPVLALVDKSLLRRAPGPGLARVRAHAVVGAFAARQLAASSQSELIRRRHAQWFRDLLRERARPGPSGSDPRELAADAANVDSALSWAADRDVELAIDIGAHGWWFWYRNGRVDVARDVLESVLARPHAVQSSRYGAALTAAGYLAWLKDDFDRAIALAEEALARADEPLEVRAMALGVISRAAGDQGNFDRARAAAAASVERYERAGDRWGAVWSRRCVAVALLYLRNIAGAEAEARRCVAEFMALDDAWGLAGSLDMLATITLQAGDLARAAQWADQAVSRHRELADDSGLRYALQHRAEIADAAGHIALARELAQESLTLAREHGYRVGALQALLLLADHGDRAAAEEALFLARALGDHTAANRAAALISA